MGKFGWGLPPGCSFSDLERAWGVGDAAMIEVFANTLTPEDAEVLGDFDSAISLLVEKALTWAYDKGYGDALNEVEENNAYLDMVIDK